IRDGHVTGVQTCALPICAKRPRFDYRDAHAEWLHFFRQRLAESFHGKLCRVVETPSRRADQSADGGQIDNMSAAALAKMRQEGAGDPNEAVDVGLESVRTHSQTLPR